MSGRDARDDWRRFAADRIPTKTATPLLDAFLDACAAAADPGRVTTLLDVGCGDGRLAMQMRDRGFAVTGIDVSEHAVVAARERAAACAAGDRPPRFLVADATGLEMPTAVGDAFDVVVCQLVLSIVGDAADRSRLLGNCAARLRPAGRLFLSASGVSSDVNAEYVRLYAEDAPLTGEPFTYYSRDESGRILYTTHHFSTAELEAGMVAAGLTQVTIVPVLESSSRRPQERAVFLYATASKPPPSSG